MSFFRKTLFWIITLVVVGGAFFFFNKQTDEADRERQAGLRLFSFQPSEVAGFWIRNTESGLLARVVRDGEDWRLKEPLAAKGDTEAITKLLENVVNANKDAVLFDNPDAAKLVELGLDNPKLEMGFDTTGGSTALIRFGNMAPTHNVAYALLDGDTRVYRIHSDIRSEADTSVYAMRDKTILSFDPPKLRRLILERRGKSTVTIVHDDRGRWDITEPEPARASMANVLKTLYAVKNSQVKAFINETPADLTDHGLDAPRIRLSILELGREKERVLSIGARDRVRRGYFARIDQEKRIFVVEESLVNALLAEADSWKDQDGGA